MRTFNDESFEICVDLGENEIFVFRFHWHLRMEGHDHTNPLSLFFLCLIFRSLNRKRTRVLFFFFGFLLLSSVGLSCVRHDDDDDLLCHFSVVSLQLLHVETRTQKLHFCVRARLASFHLVKLT